MALVLDNRQVQQCLDAAGYVEAMQEAFSAYGRDAAVNALRVDTCVPLDAYSPALKERVSQLIAELPLDADPVTAPSVMRAAKEAGEITYRLKTVVGGYPECGMMAVRISTHFDTQPRLADGPRRVKLPLAPGWRFMSMVVLLALDSGEVLGLIPDSYVQKMRVGGTTALGVKHLAREDAVCAGLLGSGAQAEAALECTATVRRLERVRVFSPTPGNRERFAEHMGRTLGIEVIAVDHPRAVFEGADIVLAATSSYLPVYRPEWVRPGMHLGIGTLLEDDPASFGLSRHVVVSLRPFGGNTDFVQNYNMGSRARPTFGQLINRKAAEIDWERQPELGELLNARVGARQTRDEITHHLNNNGCGMQFAAAGARILANARARKLGFDLPGDFFLQKEHT